MIGRNKRGVPKTMTALEVFVRGKFMTFESYWRTSNSGCLRGPPWFFNCRVAGLRESQSQALNSICCETSWSFSGNTSSKTFVVLLQKVELESTLSCLVQHVASTCNNVFLMQDKLVTNAAIRATEGFNLQCSNGARQVEEKCCPYYRTLTPHCTPFLCDSVA